MKSYGKIIIVIFVAYVLTFFTSGLIKKQSTYDSVPLEDQLHVQIVRADGTTDFHKGNQFPLLNRGDELTAVIPIPTNISYTSPVLCFKLDNCTLRLSHKGRVIYEYGYDLALKGEHIGSTHSVVPIPLNAIGHSLVLRAVSNEDNSISELSNVCCISGVNTRHWLFMERFSQAIFLITMLTASFMAGIIVLLSDGRKKFIRLSIWLLLFMFMVSAYRLASTGILYALTGSDRLCSNAEYIMYFAMPIPLLAFGLEFCKNRWSKLYMLLMLILQCALFGVTTWLNYSTARYHYVRFQPLQTMMVLLTIVSFIILTVKAEIYEKGSDSTKCLVNGLYNFFFCAILEAVRFYVRKYTQVSSPLLSVDFLFLGILLMSASFTMSIFLKVAKVFMEQNRKDYFEHLAYTDIMTGMSNRTKYYETITNLRMRHADTFTIFFMDLNNLKEVNDQFGHEYGDLYLRAASQAIHLVFQNSTDAFRLGGDEFLVLYDGKLRQDTRLLIQKLKDTFEHICEEQEFPFRGSIACGYASSTSDSSMDIEQVVKIADAKMYCDKEQIKEKYGHHCRIIKS